MSLMLQGHTLYTRYKAYRRYDKIYSRYRDYTMIKPSVFAMNLRIAEQVRNTPGCVIECGVWRGGMSAGLSAILGPQREYYLFDSFEGLPPAKTVDGEAALNWQKNTNSVEYYDNCSAPPEYAEQAMKLAGVKAFHLIKGWFDATLPAFTFSGNIALLRLDADWYESTTVCLEHLFDRVAPGGLIVLDDYYTWDGCSRAVHDYLSRRSSPERIQSLNGVCYIKKRPASDKAVDKAHA